MRNLFRIAFGGGKRRRIRDIVREAAKQLRSEAARCGLDAKTQRGIEAKSVSGEVTKLLRHYGTKVVSGIIDDKAIGRQDDKSVSEIVAISRHSEGNNNLIPKNLMTSNQLDLSLIAQDDENIFSETDHASIPLGFFASKSVSKQQGSEAVKRKYCKNQQSLLVVISSDSEGIQPINN